MAGTVTHVTQFNPVRVSNGGICLNTQDYTEVNKVIQKRYNRIMQRIQNQPLGNNPVPISDIQAAIEEHMRDKARKYGQGTLQQRLKPTGQHVKLMGKLDLPIKRLEYYHQKLPNQVFQNLNDQQLTQHLQSMQTALSASEFALFCRNYAMGLIGTARQPFTARQLLQISALQSKLTAEMKPMVDAFAGAVDSIKSVKGEIIAFRQSILKMIGNIVGTACVLAIPFPVGLLVGTSVRVLFTKSWSDGVGIVASTYLDSTSASNGDEFFGLLGDKGEVSYNLGKLGNQDMQIKWAKDSAKELPSAVFANVSKIPTILDIPKSKMFAPSDIGNPDNVKQMVHVYLGRALDQADEVIKRAIQHFSEDPAAIAAVALACYSRFRPYLAAKMIQSQNPGATFEKEMAAMVQCYMNRLAYDVSTTVQQNANNLVGDFFKSLGSGKTLQQQFIKLLYVNYLSNKIRQRDQTVRGLHRYYYKHMAEVGGILIKERDRSKPAWTANRYGRARRARIPTRGGTIGNYSVGDATKGRIATWVTTFRQVQNPNLIQFLRDPQMMIPNAQGFNPRSQASIEAQRAGLKLINPS